MSLRTRVLLGLALVVVVLGVAGVVVIGSTERHLVDQVDDQLRAASPRLGAGGPPAPGRWREGGDAGEGPAADDAGATRRLSSLYVGLLAGDELQTLAAPDLRRDDPPVPDVDAGAAERLRDGHLVTVDADRGARYRLAPARATARGPVLVVGLPLDDVDDAVSRLRGVVVLAGLAVAVGLGLVAWWVVRLGIRPLRDMTATAGAIAAGDLSRRVPEGTPGTEAGALGAALNGMLARIEEAFDQRTESEARLRQFLADASHELRTPVTTIRGYAELYEAGGLQDPGALDDAMRRTRQEARRVGDLVDDLLQLARLDQGRPLEQRPVDLAQLAADAALDGRAAAPGRAVEVDAGEPVVVAGDEARLRQVLANLVGNALVHAPGATVRIRATCEGDRGVLEVADDGPGMAPEDAARAFERFYRADASRHRDGGGAGLGLAIVEATVRAHGGNIRITSEPGAGTTVRVELPLPR